MKRVLSSWLVAVTVAFLLLCPHLKMYTVEATRYDTHWGPMDALAVTLVVLTLGTVLLFAHQLICRLKRPWSERTADSAFVLALGLSIVACLGEGVLGHLGIWRQSICVIATLLVAVAALVTLIDRRKRLAAACKMGCWVISPLVPILLLQLFTCSAFSIPHEELPALAKKEGKHTAPGTWAGNVYLFIFDEWSYSRTFAQGQVNREYPHIADFASIATVYHDAHSPHRSTIQSLPGILFQTTDEFRFEGGKLGFRTTDGKFTPIEQRRNIFSQIQDDSDEGFETLLVGWSLPYRRMFGAELDFCWSTPCAEGAARDEGFLMNIARHARLGLSRSTLSVPKPAALQWRLEQLWNRYTPTRAIETTAKVNDLALRIVGREGKTFSVFHYSVPHWPFIYDRDGLHLELRKDKPLRFGAGNGELIRTPDRQSYIDRYSGNLRYLDTVCGRLFETMKSAGTFDRSLVILTSDHTWRHDPDLSEDSGFDALTHVPLIVKLPNQSVPDANAERFELINLARVISDAIRGSAASQSVATSRLHGGG